MSEESSNQMLKQLTKKKKPSKATPAIEQASQKGSSSSILSQIKGNLPSLKSMPNKTTLIDVCLFSASVYVIYYHGKDIAKYFENMCPSEQGILDMMKKEQGGMMPPPM
jgi:hypothetical protein